MAFGTWHFLVLPIKLKGSFVMIKVRYFPEIRRMTTQAIRLPPGFKLTEMDIGMTLRTGRGQRRELLNRKAVRPFFEMAIPARWFQMTAGKEEPCGCVVPLYIAPPVRIVTGTAVSIRIILFTDIGLMDILVTIHTP